jgi:hypothetical protein
MKDGLPAAARVAEAITLLPSLLYSCCDVLPGVAVAAASHWRAGDFGVWTVGGGARGGAAWAATTPCNQGHRQQTNIADGQNRRL